MASFIFIVNRGAAQETEIYVRLELATEIRQASKGSVALTVWDIVRPLCPFHQAAILKTSNSLLTKRTSSFTCGLQVRQWPRRIIRITSNPLIVAATVFIV
jgi:hypothetical protein